MEPKSRYRGTQKGMTKHGLRGNYKTETRKQRPAGASTAEGYILICLNDSHQLYRMKDT